MNKLMQANQLEQKCTSPDDYEMMVRCANDEDEAGMIWLGSRLGVTIDADAAWLLIERYETKGNAY